MTTTTIASEDIAGHPEFRHLSTIAGIAVDLRYATPANFIGRDLYSPYDCAWLHRDAAAALERVVAWLKDSRPGCTPLVLDALRPQRVQQQLVADGAAACSATLAQRRTIPQQPLAFLAEGGGRGGEGGFSGV